MFSTYLSTYNISTAALTLSYLSGNIKSVVKLAQILFIISTVGHSTYYNIRVNFNVILLMEYFVVWSYLDSIYTSTISYLL